MIAQEVEQVFPGLVSEHNMAAGDDVPVMRKGIKTSLMIPILIKAVQELTDKVTALEARGAPV